MRGGGRDSTSSPRISYAGRARRTSPSTRNPAMTLVRRSRHGLSILLACLALLCAGALPASAAEMAATVHKSKVEVHQAPAFNSPAVATLRPGASVPVAGPQGLWFHVTLAAGGRGSLRVTDGPRDSAAHA